MSPRRAASAPPELPGFEYRALLGSGGFADVFLYQQHMPRREVAVKVLLADRLDTAAAESFTAEAHVMAQLSSHPAIVSIYEAGVAGDGRPYLVMENCPRANMQARYKREPLGIAEALRVGVQVAGAVETAHRAGILHRDIKPANILVTAYNRPALTDFGIAGAVDAGGDSLGMSIPWSPPESFEDPPVSSRRTDVYALGATVYTLLAGHSPFEIPGEQSTQMIVMERIVSTPVPPLRRADIPAALTAVLATAMAKRPEARYATALEFAHALQQVEAQLSMSVTQVDVLDDSIDLGEEDDEEDGRTRVRAVTSIDPTGPPAPRDIVDTGTTMPPRRASSWGTMAPPPAAGIEDERATVMRASADGGFTREVPGAPEVDDTILKTGPAAVAAEALAPAEAPRRSRTMLIASGAGAVVIAGGIALAVALGGGEDPGAEVDAVETMGPGPIDVIEVSQVAAPTGLAGTVDGATATFTWTAEGLADGDRFEWRTVGTDASFAPVAEPEVSFDVDESGSSCIEVRVVAGDGRVSDPVEGCAS
ncbi:serine/threonine-protein kinase [Demequina iriomotensis]|uniref:serine/threonine-protein kinase n=1 Tax=Demequina iriomotensis TaxID=1536641 RepID=UPI000784B1C5|nr:serine/threonine-protein kinase [Demequina iriomotensis]